MRKISVTLACILVLLTSTTIWTAATENNQCFTYQKDNTVYTVEFFDNALAIEQQEQIAYRLVYAEEPNTQTYGLTCTLFGHQLKDSSVGVTTHKVKTYAPRCKQEIYDVTICERCDYQTQTLSSSFYIDCCPEE